MSNGSPPGTRTDDPENGEAGAEPAATSATRRFYLKLSSLFLDPNNYRFVDSEHYKGPVPDERVFSSDVQGQTRRMLLGEQQGQVQDLLASFQQNGWLDMESIQVRLVGSRYVVVEGNRRVATLKYLADQHQNGGLIGALDPAFFEKVPVVRVAETDPFHHLVIMGLHHISGKRSWPPINQARMMRELRDKYGKSPDEICRALAIIKREFNLSIRTLALCETYQSSDYGDQFRSDKFNLFREVLKSPALRTWIGWEDTSEKAGNQQQLQRLFSWFSRDVPTVEYEPVEDLDAEHQSATRVLEAVITTGAQVRELARIIEDPEATRLLDQTRSLQSASLSSGVLARSEVDAALVRVEQATNVLFSLAGHLEPSDRGRIESAQDRLSGILMANGRSGPAALSQASWSAYNEIRSRHFDSILVESYRGLRGILLAEPGRVNLIAGLNNAGKTSLLESILLLARQSDSRALLDVLRRRARTETLPDAKVLRSLLPDYASIHGRFDGQDASLTWQIANEPDDDATDRATFESQVRMDAGYGTRVQGSTMIIRTALAPQIRTHGGNRILCLADFSSPFSLADHASLVAANEASSRTGAKARILTFLRERFTPALESIELIDTAGRFLVRERDHAEARDLASFGNGMQRVFHIAMLFASVPGGILLIDEFENAIHAQALIPFAGLLCDLAREFSVQVFLSTHSAEVIAAWTAEDLRADVVGYGLRRSADGQGEAVRFDGQRLHALREAFGFDLRGLT